MRKKEEKKRRKELRTKYKEDAPPQAVHSSDDSLRLTQVIENVIENINKEFDPKIVKPEDASSEGEQPIGYPVPSTSIPSTSQGIRRRIILEGYEDSNASLPDKWIG